MIWILSFGLIVKFVILSSMLNFLDLPTTKKLEAVELYPREISAERVVILIGDKVDPKMGAARAEVDFGSNMFQWNAMRCIFQGIPERWFLGPYVGIQSKVVYIGPRSVLEEISFSQETFTSFYDDDRISISPSSLGQDRLNHILQTLSRVSDNEGFKQFTCGKTLFLLYFSASPFITNFTDSDQFRNKTLGKLELLEKRIQNIFPDNRTLFLMIPDFRYAEGSEEVQLWGNVVKNGYHLPMKLQDVCPLISVALGLDIPLYSHGVYHTSLLNMCPEAKSYWLVQNALQLNNLAFGSDKYKEIEKLKCATCKNDLENINIYAETVRRLSIEELSSIQHSLDVNAHSCIVMSLFAWILVILTEICKIYLGEDLQVFLSRRLFFGIVSTVFLGLVALDYVLLKILSYSYRDICFYNLPLVPLLILTMRIRLLLKWWKLKATASLLFVTIVLVVAIVLIISLSMEGGYLVCLFFSLLPFLSVFPHFKNCPLIYQFIWGCLTFCVCLLLLFPSYSSAEHSIQFTNLSGIIWMCLGGASMIFIKGRRNHYISAILILYLLVATVLATISQALGMHFDWIQTSSWVLLTGLVLPLFGNRRLQERFVHSSLSFAIVIVLQTNKLELLSFAFVLAFNLSWIYLETSHLHKFPEHHHQFRRGCILIFTLILGFLLAGKIEYNNFYDKKMMLLISGTFDHLIYSLIVALKYLLVFISVLMVYLSLIEFKQPSDCSFLYCYLFSEGMCLKKLLQFYYLRSNINQELFNNIVANLFTLFIIFAYFFAYIYAAPPSKEEKKEDETTQNNESTS